jgi:predicted O-methyltransferase YrrM
MDGVMFLTPLTRLQILDFLPKHGKVAEIGVAEGNFSTEILTKTQPSELHLIDPWEHQTREDYQTDQNNFTQDIQDERYISVKSKFSNHIRSGQVHLHRKYSQDCTSHFPDRSLDWIYIDGLHSYEGVKNDLENYHKKVKEDGLILGDDYTNHSAAQHMQFGVVQAVNEFVQQNAYHLILMTWESYPTFVMTKNPQSPAAQNLIARVLLTGNSAIEIVDYPRNFSEFQHRHIKIADRDLLVPSFKMPTTSGK